MTPWLYGHCGLRVASEVLLPELTEAARHEHDPPIDIHVELGTTVERVADGHWDVSPGRCWFHVPGTGTFLVTGGERIAIAPATGADPLLLRLFLLGPAWAALLHQRGALPLHGAVVECSEGAIAFCGGRSAGKSSTAAWCLRRGERLLSDDLARLESGPDGALIWPSGAHLKLSDAALEHNGWSPDGLEREPGLEKLLMPWYGPRSPGPVVLRSIYLLEWGPMAVTRLTGIDALRRFAAAALYRPQLLEAPAALARYWRDCAEVVRTVRMFELRRPREWSVLDVALEQALGALPA